MEETLLSRLDAFPYQHRVGALMRRPPFSLPGEAPLRQAARALAEARHSAVLLLDAEGRPDGILTEQDVVRLVAADGAAVLEKPLAALATRPVLTVPAEAYLYLALGRMERLRVRHLAAVDEQGRAVGMLSARAVLQTRLSPAFSLGDGIAAAGDTAALRRLHNRLPQLAGGLLAEGLAAGDVAGVIAGVNRDLAARAAELTLAALIPERGPPPARWALLVLGSAGRGESLLAPDQDNALVHDGAGEEAEAWFAAFGEGIAERLDAAGVPFCKGGVMASRPAWRRSLEGWRRALEDWTRTPEPERLLAVDIFYDFVPVAGDRALADALAGLALRAGRDPGLATAMAQQVPSPRAPLGLFSGFRTRQGRLDLKLNGLYPLVAGARVLALAQGIAARGTLARLAAARESGRLNERDHAAWVADFQLFQDLILRQQLADLAAGRAPGSQVAVEGLPRTRKDALKAALRRVAGLVQTVIDAVAAERDGPA